MNLRKDHYRIRTRPAQRARGLSPAARRPTGGSWPTCCFQGVGGSGPRRSPEAPPRLLRSVPHRGRRRDRSGSSEGNRGPGTPGLGLQWTAGTGVEFRLEGGLLPEGGRGAAPPRRSVPYAVRLPPWRKILDAPRRPPPARLSKVIDREEVPIPPRNRVTILGGGSLGSCADEERSQLRESV